MTALWFLGIVVVIVAVGGVVLWFTNRKPYSTESSIDSFRREMDALSPKDRDVPPGGRTMSANERDRPRTGGV